MLILEVCVDSLESVLNAIYAGADELKICHSVPEGGLTPSAGLVRKAIAALDDFTQNAKKVRPKINVLLRPRSGADFCYSEQDMETMLEDIKVFQNLSVDRFVFGCLTETGFIDEHNCGIIREACGVTPVTFHRAFDVSRDDPNALQTIKELGFDRLLTAGKQEGVGDHRSAPFIQGLLLEANGEIDIVPGGGVTANNAAQFLEMGCTIIHSSCKSSIDKPQPDPCMGFGVDEIYVTDQKKVRDLRDLMDEYEMDDDIDR